MNSTFLCSPRYLFTSESVTEGHVDKMCDQISDAVLDACLEQDSFSRVACNTAAKSNLVVLFGEITTRAQIDYEKLVREVVTGIGYDASDKGFDGNTCDVLVAIARQSEDIATGVDQALEARMGEVGHSEAEAIGAGDQGMMFGYACTETPTLIPMPIYLAHKLCRRLAAMRQEGTLPWVRPDGKSQVTVEYRYGRPARVDTVLISTQHAPHVSQREIREAIVEEVILPTLPVDMVDKQMKIYVNPTGRFVTGGPLGDSGLTGRKIIVDTYGSIARHGGGAFSGKDPTKVDRSAFYVARYVAKNIVAAGLAERCEIQVAYAIGVARPLSINAGQYTGRRPLTVTLEGTIWISPGSALTKLSNYRKLLAQVRASW